MWLDMDMTSATTWENADLSSGTRGEAEQIAKELAEGATFEVGIAPTVYMFVANADTAYICMECGHTFTQNTRLPTCPNCNSGDIDYAENGNGGRN